MPPDTPQKRHVWIGAMGVLVLILVAVVIAAWRWS